MKKAEQQATGYAPVGAAPATRPAAYHTPVRTQAGARSADPSSTYRSSRYPVPAVEYRRQAP